MSFFLIILEIIFLLAAYCVIFLVFFFLSASFLSEIMGWGKPSAPFVPLPQASVAELVKHITTDSQSVIFDLGCGDGRILQALYVRNPTARYIGIDRNIWACALAHIRTRNIRSSNFNIIRGDIFKQDVSTATHITTYLFPKLMDALLPKLQEELTQGTLLYSIDFKFSSKEPLETIELNRPAKALGRRLFVYKF